MKRDVCLHEAASLFDIHNKFAILEKSDILLKIRAEFTKEITDE